MQGTDEVVPSPVHLMNISAKILNLVYCYYIYSHFGQVNKLLLDQFSYLELRLNVCCVQYTL
uniref:Uncharacterized protein n=1 Tax=Anguilla anguilla TaxID=7936 RepID=A0A0E9XJV6_ANGAN